MPLPGDFIELKGMQFYGYHGVHAKETSLGQPFRLNLQLFLSLAEAGQTDDLEQTVDYGAVYQQVKEIIEGKPFRLLEALAENIAQEVLDSFSQVQGIVVELEKPAPPIPGILAGAGVVITRRRD